MKKEKSYTLNGWTGWTFQVIHSYVMRLGMAVFKDDNFHSRYTLYIVNPLQNADCFQRARIYFKIGRR